MALALYLSPDASLLTIGVSGLFDFRLHREFRDALRRHLAQGMACRVDLEQVDCLDSSALGILLLLHERAGGENGKVELVGGRPEVRQVLEIANFHKMFAIR